MHHLVVDRPWHNSHPTCIFDSIRILYPNILSWSCSPMDHELAVRKTDLNIGTTLERISVTYGLHYFSRDTPDVRCSCHSLSNEILAKMWPVILPEFSMALTTMDIASQVGACSPSGT